MTDQDFHAIDALLRRSMSEPAPALPTDFEEKLHQRIRRDRERDARVLSPYRRIFLAAYGVVSAVTSIAVLRGQGIGWSVTALVVVSAAVLAALPLLLRSGTSSRQ